MPRKASGENRRPGDVVGRRQKKRRWKFDPSDPEGVRAERREARQQASQGVAESSPIQRSSERLNSQTTLRIVGGRLKRRSIQVPRNNTTRPMKDRTREAVFNLMGQKFDGGLAVDLFAGSGLMLFESISRGMDGGIGVELSQQMCACIRKGAEDLGIQNLVSVVQANAFGCTPRSMLGVDPTRLAKLRAVFFCPPYAMWDSHGEELGNLINGWQEVAPRECLLVVESDRRSVSEGLPSSGEWDTRVYKPAWVSVWKRGGSV